MPLIENVKPEEVDTPLQPLFPDMVTGFLRLSPHSKTVAERVIAQRQIRFELDASSNEFLYTATAFLTVDGPVHQRFRVGLKAIERTWAAIFGYVILFQWTAERFNANLRKDPMPRAPDSLGSALQALAWAFSDKHEHEILLWPKDVPSPSSPFAGADLMRSVNATAIRAVGWILLHELGHFDLGHFDISQGKVAPDAHQQELEADEWAATTATQPIELEHYHLGEDGGWLRREAPAQARNGRPYCPPSNCDPRLGRRSHSSPPDPRTLPYDFIMNTNPQPSPTQKRHPRSFAPAPASPRRTFRNNEQRCSRPHSMSETVAAPRFQSDCARLDVPVTVPGAHRKLGPTYLHVTVDRYTGCIVEFDLCSGPDDSIPTPTGRSTSPYTPAYKGAAERALCRLLRSKLPR